MLADEELGELLRALVDDAPDSVIVVDRERRVCFANPHRVGFTPGGIRQAPIEGFVPEAFRPLVVSAIDGVLQTGQPTSYETEVDTPAGRRYYSTRVGPIRRAEQIPYVSLVSTDITEAHRKRVEADAEHRIVAALEQLNRVFFSATSTEEMLEGILRQMLTLFDCQRAWLLGPCDPDASEVRVVHACAAPSVASPSALPMDPATSRVLKRAIERDGEPVRADPEHDPLDDEASVLAGLGVRSMLYAAIRPMQGLPWLLAVHHCDVPRIYGSELSLFAAVAARLRDGLESRLSQQALRQSEERFRLLVDHAPEAIVILDADTGLFAHVNDKAVELFGLPRDELLRLGPAQLSPPRQADGQPSATKAVALIAAALEGDAPVFEWTHHDANGASLECEIRLLALPHPEQRWVRGSITHIAARKRAERENERLAAQLFQAQKMQAIGQLTGGVAHDFNNLLTVISGSLAMIELEADNRESVRHFGEVAEQACRRAAALTQRLLAFSRQQPLRPQSVDLAVLVGDMERLLRRSLGETIEISTVAAPDLWSCEVDPTQLENVVLNLAINARDAMPGGGRLTIETANVELDAETATPEDEVQGGPYVMLAVSDNGTGIAPELLQKVFEPFFTTKETGKGSGLGLSMAYGFAKQSRGHLRIYSEPGHGTTVKLFLPRTREPHVAAPRAAATGEIPHGKGELILVVEDDPRLRALVVALLHRMDYRTVDAGTGPEALEVLEREPEVVLLLSDMVLPGGLTGVELGRRARSARSNLPVLYMSGYTENAIMESGRLPPGTQLIEKPFTTATLATAVKLALARDHGGALQPQ